MPPQPPVVRLVVPASVTVGKSFTADATGTVDGSGGGGLRTFRFDFGDGTIESSPNPIAVHAYTELDTYTVTVTVTNKKKRVGTTMGSVHVVAAAPVPEPVPPPGPEPDPQPEPEPQPQPVPEPSPPPPPPPQPPPSAGGVLSVKVMIDGQPAVMLSQVNATDCGIFVAPTFTQHCFKATDSRLPNYAVYFRPDVGGARFEVVFEYGGLLAAQITNGLPGVVTMSPHAVEILKDGVVQATVRPKTVLTPTGTPIDGHGWNQRWRWQSAVRPIVRTLADLIASQIVLPYDFTQPKVQQQTTSNQPALAIGDMASGKGFARNMGTVAERPDIGAVTGWLASFLAGSAINEATVRAQADVAAGTVPWVWRDRAGSGAPVSVYAYPSIVGHVNNKGDVANYIQQVGNTTASTGSYGWTVDSAHQPAALAVMCALTDDPYYLEGLQFQVAWNFAWTRNKRWSTLGGKDRPWQDGQVRGHAYSLRTMTDAWLLTPANAPSWLNPKVHYQELLEDTAVVYEHRTITLPQQAGTADPKQIMMHSFSGTSENKTTWNQFVLSCYASRCALLGIAGWQALAEWYYEYVHALCGGASGWDKRYPANYRLWVGFADPKNTGNLTAQAGAANWGALYAAQGLPAPMDANIQIDPTSGSPRRDWYYISMEMTACEMAVRLGLAQAAAPAAWLRSQAVALGFVPAKWAVG